MFLTATLFLIEPLFCLLVMVAFIPAWLATSRAGHLMNSQTDRAPLLGRAS